MLMQATGVVCTCIENVMLMMGWLFTSMVELLIIEFVNKKGDNINSLRALIHIKYMYDMGSVQRIDLKWTFV